MTRVVVTGIGAVTPLGNTFRDSWLAALNGRSGICTTSKFDAAELPWTVSGELKQFRPDRFLGPKEILRLDPFVHYAVAASLMAVEDAGLSESSDASSASRLPEAGGVIIGSSRGGATTIESVVLKSSCRHGRRYQSTGSAYVMPATTIGMASSYVARRLGIKGYCLGISNACASGANAVGEAYRLIKTGYRDPLLAGGAEAPVCRFCVEGYGASGALSKKSDPSASSPFDRGRDGFVIAEGACVMVVESMDRAVSRGAEIYGEIVGYGVSTDAFHQTRPDWQGEAAAMKAAASEAGLPLEEIGYVNAHAASTPLGDKAETSAIRAVFGSGVSGVAVSAAKSLTGHMLAASGPLEIAFTLMSIREGIVPPTINLVEQDHAADLRVITEKTEIEVRSALTNSFGFGGVNAVLALTRPAV
jgi:3-oxoacyl-[acyl-carrier-protein] synthase II